MYHPAEMSAALLAWYDRCARVLPWRGIHDSYRIWISEAMLQQTRVETVLNYYEKFIDRFPSLQDLAAAEEADVLKMWEGLGYYSRARNLLKGARQVMAQYHGVLPRDPEELRKITGIGPYTAGAIASIAFDVPVPAVDGNVLRVYSRLFGIRANIAQPDIRRTLESYASAAVPEKRPGDYNQAVMDLGATVCVPGTPCCSRCPLVSICDAFSFGDAENLPVLPRTVPKKTAHWTVPVIVSGNRTLVRFRTESLLHGLWSFPLIDCNSSDLCTVLHKKYHLSVSQAGEAVAARHVFTHLVWEMTVVPLKAHSDPFAPEGFRWISPAEFDSLAFPAAMNVPLRIAHDLLEV